MTGSTILLAGMLTYRDGLTPDLLHFVTCLGEDTVHLLWVLALWACFKNFLAPRSDDYVNQNSVLAFIEGFIAIAYVGTNVVVATCLLAGLVLVTNLRHKHSSLVTPLLVFFVVNYVLLNFGANSIDFFWNQVFKGMMDFNQYYHDDDMQNSFSFKVHMLVLCAILAFVCGQIFLPTVGCIAKVPELLPELFGFSLLVCISMFLTFLYELTSYDPVKRTRLFRTELTKVFMTCILYQGLTLLMTSWFFSLGHAIQAEADRKAADIASQRRQYDQYIRRYYAGRPEDEWPKLKLKEPLNDNELIVAEFEDRGFRDQSVSQLVSYLTAKFELFLDNNCLHLNNKATRL